MPGLSGKPGILAFCCSCDRKGLGATKIMKAKDLTRLGVPQGVPIQRGIEFVANYIKQGGDRSRLEEEIAAIVSNPDLFLGDPLREAFARTLYDPPYKQREALAPWKQWGSGLEPEAVKQMANACAYRSQWLGHLCRMLM
jgi:tRNA-splicing ligase RtcB